MNTNNTVTDEQGMQINPEAVFGVKIHAQAIEVIWMDGSCSNHEKTDEILQQLRDKKIFIL